MVNQDSLQPSSNVVPINPDIVTPEDRAKVRSRAINRAARLIEERDHLRLQIKTLEHLDSIYTLLRDPWSRPPPGKNTPANLLDPEDQISNRDRISEYKAKLDGHFKMLSKVLPDLKALELDTTILADEASTGSQTVQIVSFGAAGPAAPTRTVNPLGGEEVPTPPDPSTPLTTDPLEELEWLR